MADDEVWSPPDYMHKARTSDTSFLNEKVRLTAKEILEKKKKNIKKNRLKMSKNTHHAASSVNITKSSKKKKNKNLTSPKPVATTHSMTFLDSIANEYVSSDSENDSIEIINSKDEQVQIEEEEKEKSDSEEASHKNNHDVHVQISVETEPEDDNENNQIIRMDTDNSKTKVEENEKSKPHSDEKEPETTQIDTESAAMVEVEQDVQNEVLQKIEENAQITEFAADVKSPSIIVTDHENNVSTPILAQSADDFVANNTECLVSDTEEMKELSSEKVFDESSLLSILQTLDVNKLDKDGNGLISQHYFRYFFKQKIKKNIADQKILKIFQDIKKESDTKYISCKQYNEWAQSLTPFILDKILTQKLIIHRASSSNNFYLDQSSLIGFLKSIRIKDINDDIGVVKMFDFGLFVRRNYDNWHDVADTDLIDKIYWDIHDGHHDDRLTNEQWNKWQKALTQMHLDNVFAIQLPKDYKHQRSPRFAAMRSNQKSPKFMSLNVQK